MARYDVSKTGAEALSKLSKELLLAYHGIIQSQSIMISQIEQLAEKDVELYQSILNASTEITEKTISTRETVLVLSKKLIELSMRIDSLLSLTSISQPTTSDRGMSFSDNPEGEALVQEFYSGLYDQKSLKLVIPSGGPYSAWVDSRNILGVFHNDQIDPAKFWNHHGETKERYAELAGRVQLVKEKLDQGLSLEEIKQDAYLSTCVEQYFSTESAVRVYKFKNKYIFGGDGRHRVKIAQEMGIKIPVTIFRETQRI